MHVHGTSTTVCYYVLLLLLVYLSILGKLKAELHCGNFTVQIFRHKYKMEVKHQNTKILNAFPEIETVLK